MTQHPYADILRAIAEGHELELRNAADKWHPVETDEVLAAISGYVASPVDCYRIRPSTIRIGEFDVPAPLRVPPPTGVPVYLPGLESHTENGASMSIETLPDVHGEWFKANLARGLLHLTREAAEQHARALLAFTKPVP